MREKGNRPADEVALADQVAQLKGFLDRARHIVFFGGAGVSTESGIPDFRSQDGLYHQSYDWPPETILSHSFFLRRPADFYRFYREKMIFDPAKIRPNPAHLALARLEAQGKMEGCGVVTQNIDGLHTAAGSRVVYELHGSIHRNHCTRCGKFFPLSAIADMDAIADRDAVMDSQGIPRCDCGGIIKPDVVLYEEALDEQVLAGAVEALGQADLLIIGGTSMTVYPAAGLIRYFGGNRIVVINRDATSADGDSDLVIRQPIAEVLGRAILS